MDEDAVQVIGSDVEKKKSKTKKSKKEKVN